LRSQVEKVDTGRARSKRERERESVDLSLSMALAQKRSLRRCLGADDAARGRTDRARRLAPSQRRLKRFDLDDG
jgi:hypothetical protein